jgi:hypothetical protein
VLKCKEKFYSYHIICYIEDSGNSSFNVSYIKWLVGVGRFMLKCITFADSRVVLMRVVSAGLML